MGGSTKLFYVDESGAVKTGWIVYSWIECAVEHWNNVMRTLLDLRHILYRDYRIPASYELHAWTFLNGRGNPSMDATWNRKRHLRGIVAEQVLGTLGSCDGLRIGTVFRQTAFRRTGYGEQQLDVYRQAVARINRQLVKKDEFGLIFLDGNGTARAHADVHDEFEPDSCRLVQSPLFTGAHESQWLQMTDLVAYCAYQGLIRSPNKPWAWDWYGKYLSATDIHGGPLEV